MKTLKQKNNTDHPVNASLETTYEGGTFFFSSAQEPSEGKSVYDSTDKFAFAIMKRCAPTLLALGGTYANNVEMQIENILPCISIWYRRTKDEA